MVRKNRLFIFCCIMPAVLAFGLIFAFPIIKIAIMSLFNMNNPSAQMSEWTFAGLQNFIDLFNSSMFRHSVWNMGKIWLFGGAATMLLGMIFAVILTSGVRFTPFFKAAIYLPNIITAVAMANMWIHYVFNVKYGLFHSMFEALGLESLANFAWTSPDNLFLSMMIAYCFGSVGYYMLIFTSGIEKISPDLFSAALIDGSNRIKNIFYITLPLLKGVFRTALTLWTTGTLGFFVWSQMFSPLGPEKSIMTPVMYMYSRTFGTEAGLSAADMNAGSGAAVCIVLMLMAVVAFGFINLAIKDDKLEF